MPKVKNSTFYNLPELEQVIEAFDNDDQKIIVDLVNYVHKLSFSVAKKMNLSFEDGEDVAQEICNDLYKKHKNNSLNINNFRAFLHTAVKNQCVNIIRKKSRLPQNSLDENEWKLFTELEDTLEEEDNKKLWASILNEVGEMCKTILIKKILDGWQHEEIALHLNKKTVNIRRQYGRCKDKLRLLVFENPNFQELLSSNEAIKHYSQKVEDPTNETRK